MKFYKVNNGLNPPISLQKDSRNEGFNLPNSVQLNVEQRGYNPPKTSQPTPPPQSQNTGKQ